MSRCPELRAMVGVAASGPDAPPAVPLDEEMNAGRALAIQMGSTDPEKCDRDDGWLTVGEVQFSIALARRSIPDYLQMIVAECCRPGRWDESERDGARGPFPSIAEALAAGARASLRWPLPETVGFQADVVLRRMGAIDAAAARAVEGRIGICPEHRLLDCLREFAGIAERNAAGVPHPMLAALLAADPEAEGGRRLVLLLPEEVPRIGLPGRAGAPPLTYGELRDPDAED